MMLVDCQACPVRDVHCADCMVTALTRLPLPTVRPVEERAVLGDTPPLDPAERRAVAVLLASGLVGREQAERAKVQVDGTARNRAARAVAG